MRAAVLHRHGGPPAYEDRDEPVPVDGRALVRVSAAPIVPLDLLCASGMSYFGPPALPYVPGVQGVGTVLDSAVLAEGTRVWFATTAGMAPGDGSMSQRCVVASDDLVPIEAPLGDAEVAAVGTSGVAAWMSLTWRACLRDGENVIVLGASGMVGRTAVASARALGAGRVVAVCRTDTAREGLVAAGADDVLATGDDIDPTSLTGQIREALGAPADVVIDPVFGPAATAAAAALGPGGRLVNLGGSAHDVAEFSSAVLRGRTIAILGYTNNALSAEQRADALRSVLDVVARRPNLLTSRRFPAQRCAEAWAAAGSGGSRVVLEF
ncbi:quinone oxidoreductase family protein [Microlunatus ginsengisoli]|uniref:quinone oxidoreductase family protein n=1 Tax=Microlunatus ginsengisoli TaxID=363863 RepID=UPI0031E04E46